MLSPSAVGKSGKNNFYMQKAYFSTTACRGIACRPTTLFLWAYLAGSITLSDAVSASTAPLTILACLDCNRATYRHQV